MQKNEWKKAVKIKGTRKDVRIFTTKEGELITGDIKVKMEREMEERTRKKRNLRREFYEIDIEWAVTHGKR